MKKLLHWVLAHKTAFCFHAIALFLCILGLLCLRKTEGERWQATVGLSMAYRVLEGAYKLSQFSREAQLVTGIRNRNPDVRDIVSDAEELVAERKQRLRQMAYDRHFKMCCFMAASAVFFIAGVILQPRNLAVTLQADPALDKTENLGKT